MAYDEDLARRIRELLAADPEVTERRMSGGVAFLVAGNMAVAASGQGGLMVRVAPDETDALLAMPHVHSFQMRGRAMRGWLRADTRGVQTRRQLAPWVRRGVAYAPRYRRRASGCRDGEPRPSGTPVRHPGQRSFVNLPCC